MAEGHLPGFVNIDGKRSCQNTLKKVLVDLESREPLRGALTLGATRLACQARQFRTLIVHPTGPEDDAVQLRQCRPTGATKEIDGTGMSLSLR